MTEIQFSEPELKYISHSLDAVWNECGYDVIQGAAQMRNKDPETITIPRRDVIEICLDAGRPEQHMRNDRKRAKDVADVDDLLKRWNETDYEQKIKIAKGTFTYRRYGL